MFLGFFYSKLSIYKKKYYIFTSRILKQEKMEQPVTTKPKKSFGGNFALIMNTSRLGAKTKAERQMAKKELKAYLKGARFFRTFPRGINNLPYRHDVPVVWN
jgi:hypothetical protein